MNCPIDRVWKFYTDIKHIDIITPPEIELKITNATSQKLNQGSEIWLEGKLLILKSRWSSAIKSIIPYQYLDEFQGQESEVTIIPMVMDYTNPQVI